MSKIKDFLDSIPESNEKTQTGAAPFRTVKQSFCKKSTFKREGGELKGCWNADAMKACSETTYSGIPTGFIIDEQAGPVCSDGSLLWMVTHS